MHAKSQIGTLAIMELLTFNAQILWGHVTQFTPLVTLFLHSGVDRTKRCRLTYEPLQLANRSVLHALQSPNSHDTPARNRCYKLTLMFLTPFSGTCAIQIWERIRLIPDSDADYNMHRSEPESSVHVTEMII